MKLRITSDAHQFTLNELVILGPRSKTPGAEALRPLSYHPSLAWAMREAARQTLVAIWPSEGWDPLEGIDGLQRLVAQALSEAE